MDENWFEFTDLKRREFNRQVWVPLRASHVRFEEGVEHLVGFRQEHFSAETLLVDLAAEPAARKADANDLLGLAHTEPYIADDGTYVPAEQVRSFVDNANGIKMVLEQRIPGAATVEWIINQDFIFALNLLRVGDGWVRLEEGRAEVARLTRATNGDPLLLEVKVEFLKDYLCARKMGLLLGTFVQRLAVVENEPTEFDWDRPAAFAADLSAGWRWRGDIVAVHEGGPHQFGSKMHVFHMARTDFDAKDEVPVLEMDGPVETNEWTVELGEGRKVFRVSGEMWRTEWIKPARHSPRVAAEELPSTAFFIVDGAGTRENADALERWGNLWLWFRPDVVQDALSYPDGRLSWLTSETGILRFTPARAIHFGINDLGVLNVLAVDIGRLPQWEQTRWAAHNIAPDGTVSHELIAAQVYAEPKRTIAPESKLDESLERVAKAVKLRYAVRLYNEPVPDPGLLTSIHRFRVSSAESLYALAKDLNRLFADRIDAKTLQSVAITPPPDQTLGSLKALQRVLATLTTEDEATKMMAALFGIYDLRLADAHPGSSNLAAPRKRANVDELEPYTTQGRTMLIAFVVTLNDIAALIETSAEAVKPS